LHDVYINNELRNGMLVKACSAAWPTNFAYYAVGYAETILRPAVRSFIKWLRIVSADVQQPINCGQLEI